MVVRGRESRGGGAGIEMSFVHLCVLCGEESNAFTTEDTKEHKGGEHKGLKQKGIDAVAD